MSWVILKDPVPTVVTNRAVTLLGQLSLGQCRVERVDTDCATIQAGQATQIVKYVCEMHGDHKGITVYGLL